MNMKQVSSNFIFIELHRDY